MGLFLSALIVQNASEEDVKKSLEKAGNDYPDWYLVSEECQYQKCGSGVKVLLSDMCCVKCYTNVVTGVANKI